MDHLKNTIKQNEFKKICLCTVILLTVINIIYFNSLYSSFHFDDSASIVGNYNLKDINYFYQLFTDVRTILSNRPIVQLSFLLNYQFSHLNVFGYHLFNITIHCLAVITFFYVTRYLVLFSKAPLFGNGRRNGHGYLFPFIASLIFGIHPIFTESVVYISSRSSIIVALFVLLTFYSLIKAQLLQNKSIPVIAAIIFFFSGMSTKINFVVFPALFLLYLFCFHWDYLKGKITEYRRMLSWFFFAFLFIMLYRLISYGTGLLVLGPVDKQWTPYQYLITELNVILFYYLKKIIFPVVLSIDPLFPPSSSIISLSSISLFIILGILLFAFRTRNVFPLFFLGIFWFFITISPSSSIIPLLDFVSEHRLYLPGLGIIIAIIPLVNKYNRKCMYVLLVILLFSTLSIQRNFDWQNSYNIWSDAAATSPKKARPHFNLAKYYEKNKMYGKAIVEYKKAAKLSPTVYFPYIGIGMVYLQLKNLELAEKNFAIAHKMRPKEFEPRSKLAQVYFKKRDFEKVEKILGPKKKIPKDQAGTFYMLGRMYSIQNKTGAALEHFHKAVRANPDFVESYVGMGIIYGKQGKPEMSEKYFLKSIEVLSNNPGAYYNLGFLYLVQKKYEDAIEKFKKVLEYDPKMHEAKVAIGDIYFELKEYDEAFNYFKKVINEKEYRNEMIYKSGLCKLATGGLNMADEYYSNFNLDQKSDCDLYLRIGKLFEHNGNEDLAMKYYEIAQKLDSERIQIDYH